MKLSQLHPELRSAYRFVPNPAVRSAAGRKLFRVLLNKKAPAPPPGLCLETLRPGGDATPLHVVGAQTGGSGAAVLWLHGGGMMIGSATEEFPLAFRLAQRYKLTVVLAGYRLAPEHPFPAQIDDAAAAWAWLLLNAERRGIDPARIAVGGQSAGGGIAAMLVQSLADERGRQPAAQWLFCPMLDDRTAADRSLDPIRHRLWNNRSNRAGWKALLGVEPGAAKVPAGAVPARRENLAGLPPTWIGTGTVDLFHAEDVAYARRLSAAGVDVTLDEVEGAPHIFETFAPDTRLARSYTTRADTWLVECLGRPAPSSKTSKPAQ